MPAVRLTLHLAFVWSWLTAVVGLVWVRSQVSADGANALQNLTACLRTMALLGAVGLLATGLWNAATVGAALGSDSYGATLLVKGAAFLVSGAALVAHQQADPGVRRRSTGMVAITTAVIATALGVVLRS